MIDPGSEQDAEMEIRRYLLTGPGDGESDGPEDPLVSRVETRFLADGDFADALEAEEEELILDYLHDELSPVEREQFERLYLVSPAGRSKVDRAGLLLKEARARPVSHAKPGTHAQTGARTSTATAIHHFPGESPHSRRRWLLRPGVLSAVMSTAALFLCTASAILYVLDLRVRGELKSASLPFTLSARGPSTRAGGEWLTLNMPAGVRLVELQVSLKPADIRPAYRAVLSTLEGTGVASADGLVPRTGGAVRVVSLKVPAEVLPAGDYELVLSELLPEGEGSEVGRYSFRVVAWR